MELIMRKFAFRFMIFPLLIYFTGCGSGIQTINLALSSDVNANGGNAVVINIYQLTNDDKFQYASFNSLLNNAEETLANDLIPNSIIEKTMVPNENYDLKELELNKDTAFLGVLGDFYSPAKDGWKLIIPVDSDIESLKISIHENSLSFQKQ